MTQIDELLRQTANAVERDDETERRAIGRAQWALSAAITAAAAQDLPQAKCRGWGVRPPRRALAMLARAPRLALASGLASLAAVAAVVVVFATAGTPPAYAVTQNANGTYTVTINDVTTGVPALNAELKQLGIDAVAVPVTATCSAPLQIGGRGALTERMQMQASVSPAGGGLIDLDQANIPAGTEGVIAAYQSPSGKISLTFLTTTGSIPSCLNVSDVVSPTS